MFEYNTKTEDKSKKQLFYNKEKLNTNSDFNWTNQTTITTNTVVKYLTLSGLIKILNVKI